MRHWSENPIWTEALDRYARDRGSGKQEVCINLDALEAVIFTGRGPGYALQEALESVLALEGEDGFRGTPRLALAFLQICSELQERI